MSRSRPKARRGATIVEFALVAPLLFLVVIGMVEFGRMVMVQQILTNASREGARQGILEHDVQGQLVAASCRDHWIGSLRNEL